MHLERDGRASNQRHAHNAGEEQERKEAITNIRQNGNDLRHGGA